ncbi:heavy metal sensor kinase [Selenomonas sp. oral taxon 892 str. F0426]|uniref:sensor histidine kinase n=1 Tax=Selenomonas sp. oral taxon 892 TaxID=1321785 RepID=UPI0003AD6697|nr:ATP-binding protein [Selenomonas sp. oral taxon 892]ERJ90298.1 heavy metal sensor kinase [Selenomonas sp. oral taxon 892 str. F0426]
MLSGTKSRFARWIDRYFYIRISTKITLLYAAILFFVLILSTAILGVGAYIYFYRQAEVDLDRSIHHVMSNIESGYAAEAKFWFEGPVIPGVIVRITDSAGRVVLDTDDHFPSIETVERGRITTPVWANPEMEVSEFQGGAVYHAQRSVEYGGIPYQIHFFRTITTEKDFFSSLQRLLFYTVAVCFVLALIAGHFISRRILTPIRQITWTARSIEVERLGRRLEVPRARDELSELARTFNRMLDRLQEGFTQQQRFVSDASHELRTPLTVILGYSDMLSRWGREDKNILDEGITAIRSEAENMQQLIEKLLFLARADQKRQAVNKEEVDLAELLYDTMEKMETVTTSHEVTLGRNDPAIVDADPVLLRQLLRIFLENSLKYTPPGGHIHAYSILSADGSSVTVTLADDGIGIAPEHQDRIFDRFYRVDSSRTKETGGSGLGLSIARWIAERHDITIKLHSAVDEGTTITLTIPTIRG